MYVRFNHKMANLSKHCKLLLLLMLNKFMNVWYIFTHKILGFHNYNHRNQKVDSFCFEMKMLKNIYCIIPQQYSNPQSWRHNRTTTIHHTSRSFLCIFVDWYLYVCILHIHRGFRTFTFKMISESIN
jgi:hypothetical protein